MKIKTQSLIGPPLDWAVGVCLGYKEHLYREVTGKLCFQSRHWTPSTSGDAVIEIMEREKINATYDGANWDAFTTEEGSLVIGPTLRIAVCRCICASKLGDVVDVPEELMK